MKNISMCSGALFTALVITGAGCASSPPTTAATPDPAAAISNNQVAASVTVAPAAPTPAPAPTQKPAPKPTASPTPSVKSFTITASTWQFSPSTIKVKKGDRVRLTVTSVDVAHGLAIKEFGVSAKLDAGETKTVEFTADKTGTFTMFCNVFCGDGHAGMRGSLIVE